MWTSCYKGAVLWGAIGLTVSTIRDTPVNTKRGLNIEAHRDLSEYLHDRGLGC